MALLRVRGPLRQLAGGCPDHEIDGGTVLQVLRGFERANPAAEGWILDERGRIRRHINVFVNGEQVGEATAVSAADHLDVLPAITGGSS